MKTKLLILAALIITLTPPFLLFLPILLNYDKSANNTEIVGKNYSNLSREEIEKRLDQDFQIPSSIKLKSTSTEFNLDTASISAQINKNKLASNILYRRLNQGVMPYVKYFFAPKKFTLEISYDEAALDKYVANLTSQINKPFVPSELQYQSGNINYIKGDIGYEVESDILKQDILANLTLAQFNEPVNITYKSSGYIPTDQEVTDTKLRAQNLIGKSLILTTDTNSITVDDKTLISWLDFKDKYQVAKINDFSKNTSQSLKRDPVNAVFKFENGKVLEFKPASNGIAPDETALSQLIISSLDNLTVSKDKSLTAAIPVKTIKPLVQNDEANNLGIKELLGKGVSTFKHSDSIRNMNIEKGSSIVNRILVAPGETFSFVKNLGDVSLENGFKKAYIIRAGKTELDVGGGICQVSTTLFRAMLNAGLNITERKAHAYRVSYYEEDSKPGFDATVFIPSPDLKFINDTGHHVLIQNTLDLPSRTLTYEIYGTSDGRKVDISNYRQWDAAPPPPDVYIDDPTLPPGKVVQDEHRIPGLKTAFDWTVKDKDGKILHQKTFQSVYTPWAAVYRRGVQN